MLLVLRVRCQPALLERINNKSQCPERVPRPEHQAKDAKHRGDALEVARYGTAYYDEAEGCREERHRDCGACREEQQRSGRLYLVRDGREQQEREPSRTADAVHQPDAVERKWSALRDAVGVPVGLVVGVGVDVSVGLAAVV